MGGLRVLHIAPYSGEAWAYGGIPRVADALTRGMARRGHVVTFCATDACTSSERLTDEGGRRGYRAWPAREENGVTLRIFPNVSNTLAYHAQFFLPAGLSAFLKNSAGSFDIAHIHACRNLPGVIAARYLRRSGVPYVLAPNGTAPRIERRYLAKRMFDLAAGQRVLDGASRVIAVSEAERQQLEQLGVRQEIVSIIPNPVDLEEFERLTRSTAGPVSSEPPTVLYLGRISPRKRVDVLVHAMAALQRRDARLVIAGSDMGGERGVRQLVAALGLESRTSFAGLLKGTERLHALDRADVVVYPSADEIFGLVPLEALLTGTPVIVADDSGCAEVIRSVNGGQIVPLGNVQALSRAIEQVLLSPASWRQIAGDAAPRIRARYSADVVCAELEEVYRQVLAERACVPYVLSGFSRTRNVAVQPDS